MLHDALELAESGPVAIRYPRGAARQVGEHEVGVALRARRVRGGGGDVCILAVGRLVAAAERAAEILVRHGVDATVWDVRSCAPLDPAMIADAARHRLVVTCEDGIREGGIGMSIADQVGALACEVPVHVLGIPTRFVPHSNRPEDTLTQFGLDADGIVQLVRDARTSRA
jgi:1-deoxy-D-xylulose-5-phosphate synthase